ncbi:MAG TPA: hypothetical protein VIL84_05410 [Devosiaceae bacterium]
MKDEGKAIVGELTLKDIAQIVAKARAYQYYLRRCDDRAFQQLEFMTGSDSDGYPYEQTVSIYRRKEGVSDWLNDHEWHFVVGYEQVESGDFDYIATVRHDNNTAYKTRRPGPPVDVKFRLVNYWHPYQTPKQLGLAGDDLRRLKQITDRLESATGSLDGWVNEGLSAAIICKTLFCRDPVVLPHQRLRAFSESGLTLDGLKAKLVCVKCGKRNTSLVPAP